MKDWVKVTVNGVTFKRHIVFGSSRHALLDIEDVAELAELFEASYAEQKRRR